MVETLFRLAARRTIAASWVAALVAAVACDPCEPEDCNADKSTFLLNGGGEPLPTGIYAWSIELDDTVTHTGECFVPGLGTDISCREGSAARGSSRDLEIYAILIDLMYEVDGERRRPDTAHIEVTFDEEVVVLSETFEIEYQMGNTCTGFCSDGTFAASIDRPTTEDTRSTEAFSR